MQRRLYHSIGRDYTPMTTGEAMTIRQNAIVGQAQGQRREAMLLHECIYSRLFVGLRRFVSVCLAHPINFLPSGEDGIGGRLSLRVRNLK